jgi:type IV secretory pathway protease TraF
MATGGQPLSIHAHQLVTPSGVVSLTLAQEYWLSGCSRVPAGTLFLVGDNPADSLDSRDWGFVPVANVLGTPWP